MRAVSGCVIEPFLVQENVARSVACKENLTAIIVATYLFSWTSLIPGLLMLREAIVESAISTHHTFVYSCFPIADTACIIITYNKPSSW